MNQAERRRCLIDALIAEEPQLTAARDAGELALPADAEGQRRLLRALMNVRPPREAAPELLGVQDAYLRERLRERGVVTLAEIEATQNARPAGVPAGVAGVVEAPVAPAAAPLVLLWRGDITLLAVDAIVNAANEQGLGCFAPCHGCIDNAIHTFAGMQLRLACARELARRGEAGLGCGIRPGGAMITPAFNLPARHVIHTVGPVVTGARPRPRDEATLAACYASCLDLACERGLASVAFCCISTGVFGYPAAGAARVAVATVRDWLAARPGASMRVVFDVFSEADQRIYQELLA